MKDTSKVRKPKSRRAVHETHTPYGNDPAQLSTEHLAHCLQILEASVKHVLAEDSDTTDYEVFRNAAIKGFELTLETSGKLLRRALKAYAANPRSIDDLSFKDVLRHAVKHGLLTTVEIGRWFDYRENRNTTAHDYGKDFAEETLEILPKFIEDVRHLESVLKEKLGTSDA